MALVDSFLSAIVRADGDALVMHVGERPYVVVGTQTINISTHGLNLEAMTGLLTQLLPADSHVQLEEFGAVEYRIPQHGDDRFAVVAARGGDDIWIEIRRRRPQPTVAAVIADPTPENAAPTEASANVEPLIEHVEPIIHGDPPIAHTEPEPAIVLNAQLEPVSSTTQQQHHPEATAAPVTEPVVMPVGDDERLSVRAGTRRESADGSGEAIESLPVPGSPSPVPGQSTISAAPSVPEAEAEPMPTAASMPEPEPAMPMPIAVSIPEHEPAPIPIAASMPEPEPATLLTAASTELPSQKQPRVVLPMTRTVRIEVPPRTSSRAASGIERLIRIAAARGASALFLTSDSRPWMRIEGDLRNLDAEALLSRADVEAAILDIAPETGHESIGKGGPAEWIVEFPDIGRIRCTTFSDHRGPGVLLRMISTRAATAEQLGLPREVQALATEAQGLVLVTGPRSSGKSTLISALVDVVNRQRGDFVITLERQVRLVHDNQSALVSQREIRGGAEECAAAARAALRESPDVLVVDDLVSPQMVPLLLTAASEGLLVFVSLAAPSTSDAVQRFVELAPPEMRKAVLNAMAESFRGAVALVLLKKSGGGVMAGREVLLASAPVTRVISEGQLEQLPLAIESGRKHGMVSFTDALVEYVRSGTVDLREAFRKAPDRSGLLERLKREGVDTSVVERLA